MSSPACLSIALACAPLIAPLAALTSLAQAGTPVSEEGSASPVRVAVLFRSSDEGEQHWRGAEAARLGHDAGEGFEFVRVPYSSEDEAVLELGRILRGQSETYPGRWDLVLGPTDSGVFVRARDTEALRSEERPGEPSPQVPVISSLVTAKVEQSAASWFFRTNKDAEQRANALYDALAQRLVDSTTVLFEDNEFGRRAEHAFKGPFVRAHGAESYSAIPFTDSIGVRAAAEEVLRTRPESVGIFGRRRFVGETCESLEAQKSDLRPYDPLLFSVVDVRQVTRGLQPMLFASATRPVHDLGGPPRGASSAGFEEAALSQSGDPLVEDVFALSHDTTRLVLDLAAPLANWDAIAFRRELATVLESGKGALQPAAFRGPLTGMVFKDYENIAPLTVFELAPTEADPERLVATPLTGSLSLVARLQTKAGLVLRRYGYTPLAIVVLLAALSFHLTFRDVRRWYGGSWKPVLRSSWFLGFALFQMLLVVALYLFLAQTGRIAYDSFLAAGLIALGPAAILKSSWFETPSGAVFGPRQYYERVMLWFNERLTAELYWNRALRQRILVQFNSLPFLEERVREIYRRMRPQDRADALMKTFDEGLGKAQTIEERLEVAAEHLLRYLRWEDLIEKGCVPPGYEDLATVRDPLRVVKEICDALVEERVGSADLERLIQARLATANDRTREYYERKMAEPNHERGALFTQVRFLHLKLNYKGDEILELAAPGSIRASAAPAAKSPERLGEVLVRTGRVDAAARDRALASQAQSGRRIGEELVAQGGCTAEDVGAALAEIGQAGPANT